MRPSYASHQLRQMVHTFHAGTVEFERGPGATQERVRAQINTAAFTETIFKNYRDEHNARDHVRGRLRSVASHDTGSPGTGPSSYRHHR